MFPWGGAHSAGAKLPKLCDWYRVHLNLVNAGGWKYTLKDLWKKHLKSPIQALLVPAFHYMWVFKAKQTIQRSSKRSQIYSAINTVSSMLKLLIHRSRETILDKNTWQHTQNTARLQQWRGTTVTSWNKPQGMWQMYCIQSIGDCHATNISTAITMMI